MAIVNRIMCPLKRKANVDKRGESLDKIVMLCALYEVLLATLVCRVPFEYVEVCGICHDRGKWSIGRTVARG